MQRVVLLLLVGLAGGWVADAQTQTDDPMAQARKVLDKAMQEFLQDPDAAERVRASIAAGTATGAAASARPAPGSVVTGVPAGQGAPLPPSLPQPERSFAEMERLYLDGKISAKEFQKYLRNQKLRSVRAEAAPTTPAPAATNAPTPAPAPATTTATVTNPPAALPPSRAEGTLGDVEKRLDELIRAHEARQQAATNQPVSPPELKTQRQKLDFILKQLIDGKISEEEYKELRKKIIEGQM